MVEGGQSVANQNFLRFRKGDLLAIAAVVFLAVIVAVSFIPKTGDGAVAAEIYQDGKLIKTLSLEEETTVEVSGKYTNRITVQNGAISFASSDCPGEDCVHSGAIHSSGRSLVCLPNGVEVRVITQNSDVDFVVG